MDRLSVVIPAYNESDSIAQVIERVLAVGPRLTEVGVSGLELIVVDDGSSDTTAGIVRQYPTVKLVCHQANRGYGAALKTGLSAYLAANPVPKELTGQIIEGSGSVTIGDQV